MNYSIRELKRDENKILDTFLYEAIFIPEGVPAPSKDIINKPDFQDRKSTRLNSSHNRESRMPSSA